MPPASPTQQETHRAIARSSVRLVPMWAVFERGYFKMQSRPPSGRPLQATSDFVTRLESANTEAEIVTEVMRQVSGYGASSFIACVVPQQGVQLAGSRRILLNSWPADWLERYAVMNYYEHDPIRRCIRERHRPFLWSEIAPQYLEHPLSRQIVAELAAFGLKEGFAISLPSLDGNLIGFYHRGRKPERRCAKAARATHHRDLCGRPRASAVGHGPAPSRDQRHAARA